MCSGMSYGKEYEWATKGARVREDVCKILQEAGRFEKLFAIFRNYLLPYLLSRASIDLSIWFSRLGNKPV